MEAASLTLDELWESTPEHEARPFDPAAIRHLAEPVRRYLGHAIAPGTPMARAVRLEMSGDIKINKWMPFTAEQVIVWDRGLIWRARAKMAPGISIKGSDRVIDGEGAMRWKLLGLIPVVKAEGPDISRSAAGRLEVESIWLPSVLVDDAVTWTVIDDETIRAHVRVPGDENDVQLRIDGEGRLLEASIARWGDPDGEFRSVDFGGVMGEESSFGGYTVPTTMRIGWHFGTERFESEGEFFRATCHSFVYR